METKKASAMPFRWPGFQAISRKATCFRRWRRGFLRVAASFFAADAQTKNKT
jgi:hypothetical protein